MAVVGRKQLSYAERKKLFRRTPRPVRSYTNGLTAQYQPLIESFDQETYQLYEKLLHAYKRVQSMLNYCKNRNIQGPVLELATIRSNDLKLHQRIVQVLRHRWTDIWATKVDAINNSADKFWFKMAAGIQRRSKEENIELYPEWHGPEGREKLIEFLSQLYEKQKGICAISKTEMTLTVGTRTKNTSKCSPDRKNSNKGYTPDNIWFVAWWANAMKMDMPMIKFWERVSILAKARGLING